MNRHVFLDFDGVLFDTVRESYVVTLIATEKCNKPESIKFDTHHYHRFLKFRYLVGPAWHYKYIIELIDKEIDDKLFEQFFLELVISVTRTEYQEFENRFFVVRQKLKDECFSWWMSLHTSYPFLKKIKKIMIEKKEFFTIITTKDRPTVQKLLQKEGIDFEDAQIYDKDDFQKCLTKAAVLEKIISYFNIKKALFVDDNKRHLELCQNILNVILLQAKWGYIAPYDKKAIDDGDVIKAIATLIDESDACTV